MDFEDDYNNSINEKNKAQQEYERAQTENKKNLERAENEANVKRAEAQGKADAALIEASGQAEANRVLTESLNSKVLANNWIIKWDGKMPIVTDSNGNIIDISAVLQQ
jgi:regulator of protease activity HflC (stomatin/prohibitin superfamily)